MATSPIYSWPEPDNTDLVKNGALAIRTLGNAIDTTMATMTPKTIVDAKGDLIAASAADTPARLAVGNNGETLVADNSTSTGLRYTGGTVQANPVLNSAFQNWQRGTSISVAASGTPYTADRWQVFTNASQACTVSRQLVGDSTNLPSIQYSARVQRNSGQTGTGGIYFSQNFESINSVPFAGKTVTVSFYARAGANYSAASSVLSATMATGTGTDQNLIASGYTGAAYPVNSNATLTTTWQRFTYTGTVSATANEICLYFGFIPVGTAGANDYFDITGVQIDIGSVALPFRTYAGTIQGELAACQRYYYRNAPTSTAGTFATGIGYSTAEAQFHMNLPVTMRTRPTALDTSATNTFAWFNGTLANTPTSIALETGYTTTNLAAFSFTKSGTYAAGTFYLLYANATANAYIGVSAEL